MAKEKSLIEEALEDAEQVRETALANAKAQLEEAFTPRIKSMVSNQLKTELEEETDGYDEDGEKLDDPLEEEDELDLDDIEDDEDEEEEMEEGMGDVEDEDEEGSLDDPTNADDSSLDEEEDYDEEEGEVPGEQDTGPDEYEDDDEEVEEGRDLDLEAVIAELEADISEAENDGYEEDGTELDDPLEEEDEMDDEEIDDEEDEEIVDLDELLKSLSEEDDMEADDDDEEEEDEEMLDLEELFNSLEEGEEEENLVETLKTENQKLTSENAEYREAVEILRSKLNEVNLLNAKLLYTSKLFKKYNLNNSQKMKVVESFDRTKSVRETKLVYSTLAESFQFGGSSKKSKRKTASLTEGLASKPVKSTKPNKSKDGEIIKESNDIANRFKTLVNYNKNK